MNQLYKHFLATIFKAHSRQRLLLLAAIGLCLASFSLIFLQGIMGGLQKNLISRSKMILGTGYLDIGELEFAEIQQLETWLSGKKIKGKKEFEIELLAQSGPVVFPVLAHGIEWEAGSMPLGIKVPPRGPIFPFDLAYKLKVREGEFINFIDPGHSDSLLQDVPRMMSRSVVSMISTDVPEVDAFHFWIPIESLWNLIKAKSYNRIRLYDHEELFSLKALEKSGLPFVKKLQYLSWEEQNSSLVYALKLETSVMVFLFTSMTFLISLCIIAGVQIFLDKIKMDMTAIWILGASQKVIAKIYKVFFGFFGPFFIISGAALAVLCLKILDTSAMEIMPAVFVERKIPISITVNSILAGIFIPTLIYYCLLFWSLGQLKKVNFLEHLRAVGR